MLIYEVKGLPTENLKRRYPEIARRLGDYWLCKQFHILPRSGGLGDQWIDDYYFFVVFASAESEVMRSG